MRIKILFAIVLFPLISIGQNTPDNSLLNEVTDLKKKFQDARSMSNELDVRVRKLEKTNRSLSDMLQTQLSTNAQLEEKIKQNIQVQAQNERAVNLALDEFSKKFEEQNKTVEGVKAQLEKQWSQQVIYYAITLAIFVLVLIWSVRYSTKKALEKHQNNWNEFNEHIIKR